jgi:HEXXH motif-containing protein
MPDISPAARSWASPVLSDEAFAALAAGRPSAATVEVLRRSQLSRNLLLLHEINHADPDSGYAELAAAEEQNPAFVRHALADPMFGAWAAGRLADLRRGTPDGPGDKHHLSQLAAAVTSPADREPTSSGPTDREPDSSRPTHRGSNSSGPARSRSSADVVSDATRRLRASHRGLDIEVRLEDVDPVRARLGLPPSARLSEADFERWQQLFDQAWRLLAERHRAQAELLAAVLKVIVPVEPDPAARGISATSADAFGAVAMSVPADATAFAVGLLHETQHSLLNAVNYLFDLDRDPGRLGYSPWRDDPRPASGILHGTYAYLAVTRFWRTEMRAAETALNQPATSKAIATGRAAETATDQPATSKAIATGRAAETATDQPATSEAIATGADKPRVPGTDTGAANTDPADPGGIRADEVGAGAHNANADGTRLNATHTGGAGRGGGNWGLAAFEFVRWREAVAGAARELQAGGTLTPAGERFVGALLDEVRPWAGEPVGAPDVVRLAEGANADHRARWRLRNLVVEPGDVRALVEAWVRHEPAPKEAVTSRLVPAPRRALESSARLDLAHARVGALGSPRALPGGRATAGDLAYLRGDGGTAVDAYKKVLASDDTAWAGIAVLCGWEKVEVVTAVWRALRGAAEVTGLAGWIFG